MTDTFTPTKRKLAPRRQARIAELTAKIDQLSAFDAAWFIRTGRRYRLRPSYPAEIARQELVTGRQMKLDGDCSRWLAVICDCGNGIRSVAFMQDCALDGLADPGEAVTASIYEMLIGGLS